MSDDDQPAAQPATDDRPPTLFGRLAALVTGRLRWAVVIGWIVIAAAATVYLPTLSADGGDLGIPVPDDAPALRAEARSAELFGYPLISRNLVVQRDPAGLSEADRAQLFERVLDVSRRRDPALADIAAAVPLIDDVGLAAAPGEEGTTAVTYLFFGPGISVARAETVSDRFASSLRTSGTLTGVTGTGPARNQQFAIIQDRIGWVVIATLAVIALIVGLVFRTLTAPLLTLATAGVAYLVDLRVIAWLSERTGIPASTDLEPVVAALLLGIVTDYSLFYLFGVRQRMEAGDAPRDAARWAAGRYAPIVATAGFTVAAGTASLLVGGIDFFRSFGPGLAATALVGMVVALTLMPALLSIAGGRIAPRAGRTRGRAARVPLPLRLVTRRPIALLAAVVTVGLLLLAASGLRETTLGSGLTSGLPVDAGARGAADAIDAGFPPGVRGPTELLLEGPGVGRNGAALASLATSLREQPGVAEVVAPGAPVQATPLDDVLTAPDGNAARMLVVLRDDPTEHEAIATIRALEGKLPALLQDAGLAGVTPALAGDSALATATIDATSDELLRVGIVAALVNLLLLGLFLRAVLAPLYLLAASALSVAASLGLATYLFQDVLGQGQLVYYIPFATAVLLLALGSDYNIFLVGQIWEDAAPGGMADAVRRAGARAGGTIAVAGLVLAASFGLLAIVPLDALRQFAVVMSLGILIDAFIVRSVLVPALVVLFGDAGRWPGAARRPRGRVERGEPVEPEPAPQGRA